MYVSYYPRFPIPDVASIAECPNADNTAGGVKRGYLSGFRCNINTSSIFTSSSKVSLLLMTVPPLYPPPEILTPDPLGFGI